MRRFTFLAVFLFACSAEPILAVEDPSADAIVRIPPMEPAEAMKSFEVVPGFHLELTAAEPLVHSPVAMAFDERGRLYVVEMCDYSEQKNDFLGNVRLLEDTDGDGRFDKSTLFAEHLSWPTAIICYDGGVFVGAAPGIFYCKDTNGDGKSDEQKTVFTGFGRTNVQGLLNSFQWGFDNRIYGATSSSGGKITCPVHPDRAAVECRGRDFSFDPRTLNFRTESGGAQHGLSFDDWGHRFDCSNGDHLQMIMFEDRYGNRNPTFAMPAPRLSIAADGPQAEVYRISPVEKWREIRTQWRATGKSKGKVEGGGRASGYFTSATGITCYRGDAFPAEFRQQAFVGDVGSNIIHRKKLEPNGVPLVGKRLDEGREFVASKDIWFRPVQFANAPDGTLYIADMYRETIEHPDAIPPELKQKLDLTSGRDRGRIYRLVPDGYKQRPLPKLDSASTAELVKMLEHRNGWHRDTALRLLYERRDPAAPALLQDLLTQSKLPEARILSLNLLHSLNALSADVLLRGLEDPNPAVREHAVRLAEEFADVPAVSAKLRQMTADADLSVRYQLAFSLGALPEQTRVESLAKLARKDAGDPWMVAAIFSSLPSGAGDMLTELAADKDFRASPPGRNLLTQLATQISLRNDTKELQQAEACLLTVESADPVIAAAIVRGLASGVAQNRRRYHRAPTPTLSPTVTTVLDRVLKTSGKWAVDESRPLDDRLQAIRTLGLGKYDDAAEILTDMLASQHPQEIQLAAIETLGQFEEQAAGEILIGEWPSMTPRLRSAASNAIFSRAGWLLALLDAVDEGTIRPSDLDLSWFKLFPTYADKKVRKRAAALEAKWAVSPRQQVLEEFHAALELPGDADRGKAVFRKNCAACHQLEGFGHAIGANLAAFKNRGAQAIFQNVLDPNREVLDQYKTYVVQTFDGRQHVGIIVSESSNSLKLQRSENETETLLNADIEMKKSTGQSLMPEGLEKQLETPQALADLIAYILSQK